MKNILPKSNIAYIIIFICFVFGIILASLTFRLITEIQKSKFKDPSFTFLVVYNSTAEIVQVDASENTVSLARIDNVSDSFINAPLAQKSLMLSLPLEGEIKYKNKKFYNFRNDFFNFFSFTKLAFMKNGVAVIGMNTVDLFKIYKTGRSVKDVQEEKFAFSEFSTEGAKRKDLLSEVSELFRNPRIVNEAMSIEVINNTDKNGLATAVSEMLANAGFNIIFVSSGESQKKTRIIYRGEETESVRALQNIFGISPEYSSKSAVSDVSILLGEDYK